MDAERVQVSGTEGIRGALRPWKSKFQGGDAVVSPSGGLFASATSHYARLTQIVKRSAAMSDPRDRIAKLRAELDRQYNAKKSKLDELEETLADLEKDFFGSDDETSDVRRSESRPKRSAHAKESGKLSIEKSVVLILEEAKEPLSTPQIASLVDVGRLKTPPKNKSMARAVASAIWSLKRANRLAISGDKYSLR